MGWMHELAYFGGGVFLANAIPHVVSGLMGRPFQSPFAKPRGEGLSSATVNVVWGFANLVVAYLLICRVGESTCVRPPMPQRSGSACSCSRCRWRTTSAASTVAIIRCRTERPF